MPLTEAKAKGFVDEVDLRRVYFEDLRRTIDLDIIKKAKLKVAVDLLYGTGRDYLDRALRDAGVEHLMVEGGANLAGAMLGGGFVDRLIIFQAPVLLGAGALPAFGVVSPGMGAPGHWRVIERREFGDDLMTTYAPAGR